MKYHVYKRSRIFFVCEIFIILQLIYILYSCGNLAGFVELFYTQEGIENGNRILAVMAIGFCFEQLNKFTTDAIRCEDCNSLEITCSVYEQSGLVIYSCKKCGKTIVEDEEDI